MLIKTVDLLFLTSHYVDKNISHDLSPWQLVTRRCHAPRAVYRHMTYQRVEVENRTSCYGASYRVLSNFFSENGFWRHGIPSIHPRREIYNHKEATAPHIQLSPSGHVDFLYKFSSLNFCLFHVSFIFLGSLLSYKLRMISLPTARSIGE